MTVVLTGEDLVLDEVVRVARDAERVEIAPGSELRMREARAVVDALAERGEGIYGLTVGVGSRARAAVSCDERARFNSLLLRSHRVAQGPDAPRDVVRATMLRLANGFAKGTTMATPELARLVVSALNEGREPAVRLLGSLGMADVAQLVDLALGLIDGHVLAPGEGLVVFNNNAFSTAYAALAIADCERLVRTACVSGSLDLEAFGSHPDHIHQAVAQLRPYPGIGRALTDIRALLEGSYLWSAGSTRHFQDPLTFRCLPQVHGATRDALHFARGQLEIELNASQSNPVVLVDEDRVLRVGNFDVLPLASALDLLRIALATLLTTAAERAVKLLQAPLTGLTDGLAASAGSPEDGVAELDRAAYALAAEARLLAQPVSFELSGTTISEGLEDRMTMAPLAARRLAEMVSLGERIIAIELVIAAQAIDLRRPPALGRGTSCAVELIRQRVAFTGEGEALPQDLEPIRELVASGELADLVSRPDHQANRDLLGHGTPRPTG